MEEDESLEGQSVIVEEMGIKCEEAGSFRSKCKEVRSLGGKRYRDKKFGLQKVEKHKIQE